MNALVSWSRELVDENVDDPRAVLGEVSRAQRVVLPFSVHARAQKPGTRHVTQQVRCYGMKLRKRTRSGNTSKQKEVRTSRTSFIQSFC